MALPSLLRRRCAHLLFLLPLLGCLCPASFAADLRITEFLASNRAGLLDEEGDDEDWIEIENFGATPVSLAGYGLTDNLAQPFRWTFPDITLAPGERTLVFASDKNRSGDPQPGLLREVYSDISGTSLADLEAVPTFPDYPSSRTIVTGGFEVPVDLGDNYGQRLHGFVLPPATGNYTFWIASDDHSQLLLSPDDDPRNAVPIASVTGHTGSREYTKYSSQQSAAIFLEAGRRYAIVALHKEGTGGDNLSVRWRLPDDTIQTPIPVDHLLSARTQRHTNFKIGSDGEELRLTAPDGTVIDTTPAVALPGNVSYGRLPDDPATWAYFASPTPGAANTTQPAFSTLPAPVFSVAGGFHTSAISLSISSPDPAATILYTLDGSEPLPDRIGGETYPYKLQYPYTNDDPVGPLLTGEMHTHTFAGPIAIADRTPEPNRISTITTTYDTSANGYAPTTPVFKGTVVRARLVKDGALLGPIVTHTYFVTPLGPDRYALPVISVAVDEAALFDYHDGIYVAGEDFDQWRANSTLGPQPDRPANYSRRGVQHEKPVHFELFLADAGRAHAQNLGMRIHGGWSRAVPMKTLRFYGSDAYNDADWLDHPLIPGLTARGTGQPIQSFRRFLLRNSGNEFNQTMMKDAFIQEFIRPLGLDQQGYQPAVHFINGEFWGLTNIRERIDRFFLESHHGVDPDDVVILSNDAAVEEGLPADRDPYLALRTYIRDHDMAEPVHYAYAAERIDLDNLILYFVAQIYAGNTDWPHNNIDYWRVRTADPSPSAPAGRDGRWRWILYDMDHAFKDARTDTLSAATTPRDDWQRILFGHLLDNPDFRARFINAFSDHLATTFRSSRADGLADAMQAVIASTYPEHHARWRNVGATSVQSLKNYASARPGHLRSHLAAFFGLPATVPVTVNVPAPSQGAVRLNTVTLTSTVTGDYYPTIPITVTAVPETGFAFDGWLELPGETSATLTVSPAAGLTLTPQFVETTPPSFVHYWNFNNTATLLAPTVARPGAALAVEPGEFTEVLSATGQDFSGANALFDDPAGAHLRVNNPLGSALTFALPTTGFEAPVVAYETRRSGQGAAMQHIAYTLDGATFVPHATVTVPDGAPNVITLDFSDLPASANNPAFGLRITFSGGTGSGSSAGNNRFDNVTVFAVAIPGANQPPVLADTAPAFLTAIAGAGSTALDLNTVFTDPEGAPLTFTIDDARPGFAGTSLVGSQLTYTGLATGETTLILTADDGQNPPLVAELRLLVHPAPHALADGAFHFTAWAADAPELTFPAHMLFLQGAEDDATLSTPLDHAYHIPHDDYAGGDSDTIGQPYNNTSRTRLNGLGADGVAFINTGRGRDLGGALVALDTRDVSEATVAWLAGTVTPNVRVYALRPQYRLGATGPWLDLPGPDAQPIDYLRNDEAGHAATFGPLALPPALLGQPYVQFLWRYHHVSGGSGARAQLRLDDIAIATPGAPAGFTSWVAQQFPDPADQADPAVSGPAADPLGQGVTNLLRYALGIDLGENAAPRLPRLETGATDGVVFRFPYDPALTDIAYRVEGSTDLLDWSETVFDSRLDPLPPLVDGWLEIEDPAPPETTSRRFLRLRVLLDE